MDGTNAYAIFEGGGVRGIGLVGALQVAVNRFGYNFIGVAGTSAGSIVAALYAANWPISGLLKLIKDKNFVDFLDGMSLDEAEKGVQEFKDLTKNLTGGVLEKAKGLKGLILPPKNLRELLGQLNKNLGVFRGDAFVKWLDDRLRENLPYAVSGRVTFEDLELPLKIVATNLTTQQPIIFSKMNNPQLSVADAVRASLSIPFLFHPHRNGTEMLLDGGLMSNFPAWVFDEERDAARIVIPTIGFRLVEEKNADVINDIFTFGKNVLSAGMGGYKGLQQRGIDELTEINIPTKGISFVKFNISDREKDQLLDSGEKEAFKELSKLVRPKSKDSILLQLESACQAILQKTGQTHIRANIFRPFKGKKIKILYQYNMDTDPDQEIEFNIDGGATGRCWQSRKIQIVDLGAVRQKVREDPNFLFNEWKMEAQEHQAVRTTLNALLSIPIFDLQDSNLYSEKGNLIGVLNFDSDHQIQEIGFDQKEIVNIGKRFRNTIAELLKPS